jgi:hypothetical protein
MVWTFDCSRNLLVISCISWVSESSPFFSYSRFHSGEVRCEHPPAPLAKATVYTQVIKSNPISDKLPPSPQFLGNRTLQNPPELGDFGDAKDSNEVRPDLCVHGSLAKGGYSVKLLQPDAGG